MSRAFHTLCKSTTAPEANIAARAIPSEKLGPFPLAYCPFPAMLLYSLLHGMKGTLRLGECKKNTMKTESKKTGIQDTNAQSVCTDQPAIQNEYKSECDCQSCQDFWADITAKGGENG